MVRMTPPLSGTSQRIRSDMTFRLNGGAVSTSPPGTGPNSRRFEPIALSRLGCEVGALRQVFGQDQHLVRCQLRQHGCDARIVQMVQHLSQEDDEALRYVIGDTWNACNVAFYSDDRPSTLFSHGGYRLSPW
ncbi:hypothetical protein LMG23994_06503 [Cupriavidus pinatubonensis]|uniref:Uncharacterized protein n=1 Tax=Cupriavidus pinatubonensis TaxID=248026 RepID=A0ABM8Y2N7_9BURK|nr:hypothetical protein LMG23994_06503 [Cupriavidus pinatubonensis]